MRRTKGRKGERHPEQIRFRRRSTIELTTFRRRVNPFISVAPFYIHVRNSLRFPRGFFFRSFSRVSDPFSFFFLSSSLLLVLPRQNLTSAYRFVLARVLFISKILEILRDQTGRAIVSIRKRARTGITELRTFPSYNVLCIILCLVLPDAQKNPESQADCANVIR